MEMAVSIKGILKLDIKAHFGNFLYLMKTWYDIYETWTRFLSMKLCKSDIIHW
jgi:hypothetical protein